MPELAPPIQAMIDATNREDPAALLDAFADDAVLVDGGREFAGKAAIARWDANENTGTNNRFVILGVSLARDRTDVVIEVSGNGFNGRGTFSVQIANGRIQHLDIS